MFVDEAVIGVEAGDGGDGCVSFRREKYVPRGGPNGGDGGRGGSVIIRTSRRLATLADVGARRFYRASKGAKGLGKLKHGSDGNDVLIEVPVGTIVRDVEAGFVLRDLSRDGQQLLAAKGGAGGQGNKHFATATNQTPRIATSGGKGEKRTLRLELKIMADVGLIGMPNAGKSTLLRALSDAHPKVAAYPFTTLVPQLGIVEVGDYDRFLLAEVPGLIEGAHEGVGLGVDFLRHVERTRVLVHVVDMASAESSVLNATEVYRTVRRELRSYGHGVYNKTELVVANKMDLPGAADGLRDFRKKVRKKVWPVSALEKTGLEELKEAILDALSSRKDLAGR